MKKIVVSDTNIFIDLISINLLDGFFCLPWEIHTTDMIVQKLIKSEQHKAITRLKENGHLIVKKFDGEELAQLARMKLERLTSNASIQDCSVWKLAKDLECALLTGDNKLRKIVQNDNIEVHGILYLFDKMLEHKIMDNEPAINKLQSLFSINSRLPKEEIDKRIALWKEAIKE